MPAAPPSPRSANVAHLPNTPPVFTPSLLMRLTREQPRQHSAERYIEGFLSGRTVTYREMVKNGIRLAGETTCPDAHLPSILALVARERCKTRVE
jgi:hypothetical protein